MQPLTWRRATSDDLSLLAEMNHCLIADEGHSNPMTVTQLRDRMAAFISTDYTAILFSASAPLAYALYRPTDAGHHIRQFFVERHCRRMGIGRAAMRLLLDEILPTGGITLEVLAPNHPARAFYAALGFTEYSVTLELKRR